jgi:hypothetical protein
LNRKLLRNLKKAEVEKESLCAQLLDVNAAVDFLKLENFSLLSRVVDLEDIKDASKFDYLLKSPFLT